MKWSERLRGSIAEGQRYALGAARADRCGGRNDPLQRSSRNGQGCGERFRAELQRQLDAADDVCEAVTVGREQTYLEADGLIVGKARVHGEICATLLVEESYLRDRSRRAGGTPACRQGPATAAGNRNGDETCN